MVVATDSESSTGNDAQPQPLVGAGISAVAHGHRHQLTVYLTARLAMVATTHGEMTTMHQPGSLTYQMLQVHFIRLTFPARV